MKKITSILALCFLFINSNIFAQKITDEEFAKGFSEAFCDCAEKDFKGFSKDFVKRWNYFKEDYKTKYRTDTKIMKNHLQKNQKDREKFQKIVQKTKKIGKNDGCDLIFVKDKNLDNQEMKSLLLNNFDRIKTILLSNKKCQNSFVMFNFLTQIDEE